MKPRLVTYRGGKIDLAFPLQGPRVTIGREPDNQIQLPHEKVSKHHAVVLEDKGGWWIEDLQSTNGLLVNGRRTTRVELRDGDSVSIGPYEFFFELDVPTPAWVPSHIIDLSTEIQGPTIFKSKPPKEEGEK